MYIPCDSTGNIDYESLVTRVNFTSGENETTVSITITDDDIYEGSEYFTVGLRTTRDGTGIMFTQETATIAIIDNDGKNLKTCTACFTFQLIQS